MGEDAPGLIRPFANGAQYADWLHRNCYRCVKGTDGERWPTCPIDDALSLALFTDGTVTEAIGRRMGYDDVRPGAYTWRCLEFEAK